MAGWDFSWLDGRAREERPSWAYAAALTARLGCVESVLDVQTGGGEVFGEALGRCGRVPGTIAATESWSPNLELARRNLSTFGATVEAAPDEGPLPFGDAGFVLVVSRHPVVVPWHEIARVLHAEGTFFSQQVGPGSNSELSDALMGPQPISERRSPERAVADAEAAGLVVVDLRAETLRVEFDDIGTIVYFLRKVPWTVPGFRVERYRDELLRVHRRIGREGPFVSHARRFLIEVTREGSGSGSGSRGRAAVRDL